MWKKQRRKKYDAKDKCSSPDNIKFALSLPENNNPNDVIIDARDEVDQSFVEFLIFYYQKCHLAGTGYMKYIITKSKDF